MNCGFSYKPEAVSILKKQNIIKTLLGRRKTLLQIIIKTFSILKLLEFVVLQKNNHLFKNFIIFKPL